MNGRDRVLSMAGAAIDKSEGLAARARFDSDGS